MLSPHDERSDKLAMSAKKKVREKEKEGIQIRNFSFI